MFTEIGERLFTMGNMYRHRRSCIYTLNGIKDLGREMKEVKDVIDDVTWNEKK